VIAITIIIFSLLLLSVGLGAVLLISSRKRRRAGRKWKGLRAAGLTVLLFPLLYLTVIGLRLFVAHMDNDGEPAGGYTAPEYSGSFAEVSFGGIDWFVIANEPGRQLLLSVQLTEREMYYADGKSADWAGSTIRAYLNGDFLAQFTPAEQEQIRTAHLTNGQVTFPDGTQSLPGGSDTDDKVFLLSYTEAEQYLPTENNRILPGAPETWWLRSPGDGRTAISAVDGQGQLCYLNTNATLMLGIRPAMWVAAGERITATNILPSDNG
jgi:hypothetical protein